MLSIKWQPEVAIWQPWGQPSDSHLVYQVTAIWSNKWQHKVYQVIATWSTKWQQPYGLTSDSYMVSQVTATWSTKWQPYGQSSDSYVVSQVTATWSTKWSHKVYQVTATWSLKDSYVRVLWSLTGGSVTFVFTTLIFFLVQYLCILQIKIITMFILTYICFYIKLY